MAVRQVVAGEAYVTPEGVAVKARAAGEARRRALNPKAAPAAAVVRKVSVLDRLEDAGRLKAEQVQAGQEIEAYWHRWTASLFGSGGGYAERLDRSHGFGEPLIVGVKARRYQAWAAWADQQAVRGDVTLLTLTLAFCVDGLAPRAVRELYRIDGGRALRLLQMALMEYAKMAGWVEAQKAA